MTLADLPVLNPSTPGREARRAILVAILFAAFGALYALARAAAAAPPDLSASTGDVFGFAYPHGWGLVAALWSGAARWPAALANAETFLAVSATVIMAIALIVVMHPDLLVRQGPQYVSPARRITTVVVAFVLAFVMYRLVIAIDNLFSFDTLVTNPDRARRELVGLGALSAIIFGGIWSFIGPKDFGRRIPLRISHGALGGIAVWGAVALATLLSSQARTFLSSTLDTFLTLFTVDAANGTPGATAAWAVSSDVLTAATAMALAGSLLIVTAPQSLGPGNRRGSAIVSGVVALFLIVVAATTWSTTQARAREVNVNVVSALGLERTAPARTPVLLIGQNVPAARRIVARPLIEPTATADDCLDPGSDNRTLPARSQANVQKLTNWLQTHQDDVNGTAIRVASCRAALQALLWEPDSARAGIFLDLAAGAHRLLHLPVRHVRRQHADPRLPAPRHRGARRHGALPARRRGADALHGAGPPGGRYRRRGGVAAAAAEPVHARRDGDDAVPARVHRRRGERPHRHHLGGMADRPPDRRPARCRQRSDGAGPALRGRHPVVHGDGDQRRRRRPVRFHRPA